MLLDNPLKFIYMGSIKKRIGEIIECLNLRKWKWFALHEVQAFRSQLLVSEVDKSKIVGKIKVNSRWAYNTFFILKLVKDWTICGGAGQIISAATVDGSEVLERIYSCALS